MGSINKCHICCCFVSFSKVKFIVEVFYILCGAVMQAYFNTRPLLYIIVVNTFVM